MSKTRDQLLRGFAKALEVPADEKLRRYLSEGNGGPRSSAHLLAWDANSIHAFVFDTTNATGIRGASRTLAQIDEMLIRGQRIGLEASQILFAGGGSGLAVVQEAQIEGAIARLHELFAEETLVATCTTASAPLLADGEAFKNRVTAVYRRLDRSRIRTGPDCEPAVPFFAQRCAVCGRRAAARIQKRGPDRRPRLECEPCFQRIQEGKADRHAQDEPSGFEEIEDKRGYALLYLDGNGIGKAIAGLNSPFKYAEFSRELAHVMSSTFDDIARDYGMNDPGKESVKGLCCQRPICGGDDLVAILPARQAVLFTRDLMQSLEKKADDEPSLKNVNFGSAAGLAISRPGYPVRHLLTEAQALLKNAKELVYRSNVRSALDFSFIKDGSPRAESVEPQRLAAKLDPMLQSGRPYSLEEATALFGRVEKFKSCLGRSQLFALQRQAQNGPNQLRNYILYQVGRHPTWRDLIDDLARQGPEAYLDADQCFDQIVPRYNGTRVFDVNDILDLMMRAWPATTPGGEEVTAS